MVSLSSAEVNDSIAIIGPLSLDYLVVLLRLGYECAVCMSGEEPRPCGEPIDHLFVTGPMKDDQLATIIASVGPQLRRNGTIVASLREPGQDKVIAGALRRPGLVNLPAVFAGSGHFLASYRYRSTMHLAIAA